MKMDVLQIISTKLFMLCSISLFLISTNSSALPFDITPKIGTQLPTVVKSGKKVTAYYTVTNNTLAARNNNFVKYLPPNVTQITSDGTYPDTCGNVFNLAEKGKPGSSCTLQLSISGAVNSNDPDPHHHLFVCFPGGITCAGTQYSLNVAQDPSPLKTAYITNFNDGSVSRCPIQADGNFGRCTLAGSGLGQPVGISFSKDFNYVYLTLPTLSAVLFCPINNDGTFGICNLAGGAFIAPSGIVVNPAGNLIYITDVANFSVSYCTITANGAISSCTATGQVFGTPLGITINPPGTYAYIADPSSGIVSSCQIQANGNLINCVANADPAITLPYAVAVNPLNTLAYIVNADNSVVYCTINSNGSLGTCNATGNDFNLPVGIALNPEGTTAYITNENGNTVSACPIKSDGSFGTCITTGNNFVNPSGIALY